MLTGSRLGAAFVVLLTAVIYALRGGEGERHEARLDRSHDAVSRRR